MSTGRLAWTHTQADGWLIAVDFTPDGEHLAALWRKDRAEYDGSKLVLLDATTGSEIRNIPITGSLTYPIVFAPGGKWLAGPATDFTIQLVNTETGATLRSAGGHRMTVSALAFSPDGTRLASASYDQTIKIWDTTTGQETLTLRGHKSAITSIWFTANGHRLISCERSGTIRTWDATPLPENAGT